jgi:hypothetical protein
MTLLPLTEGFYTARSVIASSQRCVNLYGEKNPKTSPFPYTFYPRPGLKKRAVPPTLGVGRGLYTASNGNLYAVIGPNIFFLDQNFNFNLLGQFVNPASVLQTPVGMGDNGGTLVVVDGTPTGYQVDLPTNSFSQITDPNFFGADSVDYIDTFMVFNQPGTTNFYSSLSATVSFDPTYVAPKSGWPDPLLAVQVVHREIWLHGAKTTEIWGDAGAAQFPFAPLGGVFIQKGCVAKYSPKNYELMTFWLGQDKAGQAQVYMGRAYNAVEISTPAMVNEFAKYPVISDAIGMIFQLGDHPFYVLTFPAADKTWAYDISTSLWMELVSIDSNGLEHRWRPQQMAFAYGLNVALDWQTGAVYQVDNNTFLDDTLPVIHVRGFPHIVHDGKRQQYYKFVADMETGTVMGVPDIGFPSSDWSSDWNHDWGPLWPSPINSNIPQVSLRWADDRGVAFGDRVLQPLGATGKRKGQPAWRRLGYGRDRVFEVSWSAPCQTALNGAFVDAVPLAS